MEDINKYGFRQYKLKDIKKLTEMDLYYGQEPNMFNLIAYAVRGTRHQGMPGRYTTVVGYFDTKNNKVIEIAVLKDSGLVSATSFRKHFGRWLESTGNHKYLHDIKKVVNFDDGFELYSIDETTMETIVIKAIKDNISLKFWVIRL